MRARLFAMSMVLACILGSCAPMAERGDFPPRAPIRMVGGTATPIVLEREVRYYVDEQGTMWDDSGRKQERPPLAAATVRP